MDTMEPIYTESNPKPGFDQDLTQILTSELKCRIKQAVDARAKDIPELYANGYTLAIFEQVLVDKLIFAPNVKITHTFHVKGKINPIWDKIRQYPEQYTGVDINQYSRYIEPEVAKYYVIITGLPSLEISFSLDVNLISGTINWSNFEERIHLASAIGPANLSEALAVIDMMADMVFANPVFVKKGKPASM